MTIAGSAAFFYGAAGNVTVINSWVDSASRGTAMCVESVFPGQWVRCTA